MGRLIYTMSNQYLINNVINYFSTWLIKDKYFYINQGNTHFMISKYNIILNSK